MADYILNCVPSFKKERIVYFILGNILQMWYAFMCNLHVREEYKGLSRECHHHHHYDYYHVTIISLLNNIMLHKY